MNRFPTHKQVTGKGFLGYVQGIFVDLLIFATSRVGWFFVPQIDRDIRIFFGCGPLPGCQWEMKV